MINKTLVLRRGLRFIRRHPNSVGMGYISMLAEILQIRLWDVSKHLQGKKK